MGRTWQVKKDPKAVLPQNPAQRPNFQLTMRFDTPAASRFRWYSTMSIAPIADQLIDKLV